jgi:capsular exopolysaccharide synthesis family protein
MEELASHTLAQHVVNSLGLQIRLKEPAGPRHRELITQARIAPDVAPAKYRLVRAANGEFLVKGAGEVDLVVEADGKVVLPGASFVLAPAARAYATLTFEVEPLEQVVEELREDVRITRSSDDVNMIALRYRHRDRDLATAVLLTWTDRYVELQRDVQKAEASRLVVFLRDQLDTLSAELSSAQEELRAFREREQVLDPQVETATELERDAALRAERGGIEAERLALSELMADMRASASRVDTGQAGAYRQLIAFPPLLRTQATSELLRSLAEIEHEQASLSRRRSAADPDARVLMNRRRELERQLRGIAETYLAGLTQQVAALDRAIAESAQRANRIPAREVEYARMKRGPEVLDEMVTLVQTRLKEAQIAEASHQPGMRVVDAAHAGIRPVRPQPLLNLAFGLLFGVLIGLFGAVGRDYLDPSIHTRSDMESLTGAPVLGLIPRLKPPLERVPSDHARFAHGAPGRRMVSPALEPALIAPFLSSAVESYARLHVNLTALQNGNPARTLLLTSPLPGDGKTLTAKNLAISLSQRGYRALLVDADLRRGVIHRLLGGRSAPGLTDILERRADLANVLRTVVIEGKELHYLACGTRSEQTAMLLSSDRFADLVAHTARDFDAIIMDSPPLNLVSDAAILSNLVDGVIVVARAGTTPQDAIEFTMRQLRLVGAPVLGTVLNDIDPDRESTYDGAYRYLGFRDYTYFADGA